MTDTEYKRPPIVEAVIEIRFSSEMEDSALEKLSRKFIKHYDNSKPINNYNFEVKVNKGDSITNTTVKTEYHLSSQDMSQALVLKNSVFLLSQRAPYKSWEEFISRFERDWIIFKKFTSIHEIVRIGVRYTNRIDIPRSGPLVHEDEYLNIYPKHPEVLSPFVSYAVQSRTVLEDIRSLLTINSAVVPSPLPKHTSIILDQDIARETDLPQSTEDVIGYLNEVRVNKNSVFESCVTDKARELFNI